MKNKMLPVKYILSFCILLLPAINSVRCQGVIQSWATGYSPSNIVKDVSGNVYFANYSNNTVSKITPAGVCIESWATLATGTNPAAIAIDASGNLYTANSLNSVSKISPTGVCTQSWVTGANPCSITTDASGNVYTTNYIDKTVSKISATGVCTKSWVILASNANPCSIAIDASGNLYTANINNTVSKILPSGVCTKNWATLASNADPRSIAIDASGNVFTANHGNNTVSKITPAGVCTQNWITLASNANPSSITIDVSGNIYVANRTNNTVSKITLAGICTQNWATLASNANPWSITADVLGNVYTSNSTNNTISLITSLPTINSTKTPLTDYTYSDYGPSAEKSFSVNGVMLNDVVTVIAPANYEISTGTGASFVSKPSIILAHTNGTLNDVTLYVRLKAGLSSGTFNELITLSSNGAVSQNVSLNGSISPPTITTSTSTLSGFTYSGDGPSAEKTFTVSGTRLTDGIILTAPVDYEMSIFSGANFIALPTITLAPTNGVLASNTIYVRLKSGLPSGRYNESISLTSNGAVTQNISLSGTLTPTTITTSTSTLSGFTYSGKGPSVENSFTVSGVRLKEGIVLTAPPDYEMSIFTGANFIALPTITLAPTNGILTSNTIYVRLKAGLAGGTYNESITLTSNSAVTQNVLLNGTLTPPTISTNLNSIAGLTYSGTGPSVEKNFAVSGVRLTEGIVLKAPLNYEMSIFTGANFMALPTITLAPTNGILPSTTIYVRLKTGIASGMYNEFISLITGGGDSKTVALNGTVTNPAIVTNVNQLSGFNYVGVGPSADQSFTTSGLYLGSVILITAPTNFEISMGSGASFVSSSPLILSVSGGTVANTNIFTRLKAGLANGTYTGNIQLISTGAPTQTIGLTAIVGPTALQDVSVDGYKVYAVGKNIFVEGASQSSDFSVFTIYGAKITSGKLYKNKIELNNVVAGVYLIRLNNKISKVVLE